jgi:subtilase family serine protease
MPPEVFREMWASSHARSVRWMVVAVGIFAVMGFTIASIPLESASGHGSAGVEFASTSARPVAPVAGPLSEVSGASYTPQSAGQAASYGYTLEPEADPSLSGQPMSVVVSVGASQALENYVAQIQDPASPMYHQFLSLADLGGDFGISAAQYASDEAYFAEFGLSATPDPARLTIDVTGTVPQIEAAFHTQIASFSEQYYSPGTYNPFFGASSAGLNSTSARTVFLSTEAAYLPGAMNAGSVAGLSTLFAQPEFTSAFPGLSPGTSLSSLGFSSSIPSSDRQASISPAQALGGRSGSACGTQNYTWEVLEGIDWQFLFPCSMPALTGADGLWHGTDAINGSADEGQGITIGIIDVGCPVASDLEAFQNYTGVNVLSRLTVIGINTTFEFYNNSALTGCINNGIVYDWTAETSLDVEYAAAMAPRAHIDLISVGDGSLTSFDAAYGFTATYLATGAATTLPSGSDVINLVTGATTHSTGPAASSVTITSNSYGTGEELTAIFGTPVYLQIENEALDELAAIGITNVFATGDTGPTTYPFPLQPNIPAAASGVTSAGGGMLTAEYAGQEFPNTGVSANVSGQSMVVAPVSGIASYTYWAEELEYKFSATETIYALPPGETGGGFGQSATQPQPWWQNAVDTYSSGALIDPIVSGSAAFNMTIYVDGAWQIAYGGTSFATPVFAGEWALIEEQALVAFHSSKFGEINALLFAAHNAQRAKAVATNPFVDMSNIGTGGYYLLNEFGPGTYYFEGLWAPSNLYGTYLLASQDEFPQDQNLPYWYATLNNPAGPGWNYLQGLGLPNVAELDEILIGAVPATHHALDNLPFYVEEKHGSTLSPVTSLVAGSTYAFALVGSNGQPYSGAFALTTYSGGVASTRDISGHTFTYTPAWTDQNPYTNGSEYGYFYLKALPATFSSAWTFEFFAVVQPMLKSGHLTLGVETPLGLVTTGEAEVPMFEPSAIAPTLTGGTALVTLNGVPVGGAVITQKVVDVPSAAVPDPSIPGYWDAPGSVIGSYLSSASGTGAFWTDSGEYYISWVDTWEANGFDYNDIVTPPILPVSFTLQATYDGLTSNLVTVVSEPGSGYFDQQLHLSGGYVTGHVEVYDMNYLDYLNVSDGTSPGMYENLSFPVNTTYTGTFAVNVTAPTTGPVVVSLLGAGQATYEITGCGSLAGYGQYFALCGFDPPNEFQFVWADPVPFLPTSLTGSSPGPVVTGDDLLTFSGASVLGAEGTLELVAPDGTTSPLATGLSGTYALDTSGLADGQYTVEFVESAPSLAPVVQQLALYANNQGAGDTASLSALQVEVAQYGSSLADWNAQVTAYAAAHDATPAELSAAASALATLASELAGAQGPLASLAAQVTELQSEVSVNQAEVATLSAGVSSTQSQVSADLGEITTLQATVAALEAPVSGHAGGVSGSALSSTDVTALVALGAIASALGAFWAGRRSRPPRADGGS